MPQDQILSASERSKRLALPAYSLHLDLIRGLAALVVFGGHLEMICSGHTETAAAGETANLIVHPYNATGLAHAAVVVFFVLSGYLVGGSVLRDLKRNAFSWSKYAMRRLARLWTVAIPALLLGTVFDAISLSAFSKTRVLSHAEITSGLAGTHGVVQFLRYLCFLQSINRLNIPHFGTDWALWSLSNEFWYYALFPILVVGIFGTRYPKLLRAGLAACGASLDTFPKEWSGIHRSDS
jgi:peptidoglycan/LPS O-acetylase OafA/YrhL